MSVLNRIALALVVIGALNWGLIGFFRFDLVSAIFGGQTAFLSRVIFGLVGLSGLACIALLFAPFRDEEEEHETDYRLRRDPNFSAEFGEEADFTDAKKNKNKKKD